MFNFNQGGRVALSLKVAGFASPDYAKKMWSGVPSVLLSGLAEMKVGKNWSPLAYRNVDVLLDGAKQVVKTDRTGKFSVPYNWPVTVEAGQHSIKVSCAGYWGNAEGEVGFKLYHLYCVSFAPPPYNASVSVRRTLPHWTELVYQGIEPPVALIPDHNANVASLVIPVANDAPLSILYENDAPEGSGASAWHWYNYDGDDWVMEYPAVEKSLVVAIP